MDFPEITQTASTPAIFFKESEGTIVFMGESYPENSFDIYTPILQWLRKRIGEKKGIQLDINVSYMNSSSTKCMLDILDVLDEGFQSGLSTAVIWRYDAENPRSRELAEEFKEEFSFPF